MYWQPKTTTVYVVIECGLATVLTSLIAMVVKAFPLSLLMLVLIPTISADPDALQDFCVADTSSSTVFMNGLPCLNPTKVTPKHFHTSVLAAAGNTSNPFGVSVISATADVLPGINTLGLIMARVDMAAGTVVPLHTHPRATEMIFVLSGALNVGFVDTSNKLFSAEIKEGDVFVFPKGMFHFVQNVGNTSASTIAALNSQAPGISTVSFATFASNPAIPVEVLSKSFGISSQDVEKIRANLGCK